MLPRLPLLQWGDYKMTEKQGCARRAQFATEPTELRLSQVRAGEFK
jgi:hypothetical protein